jgi:hypothetical protein
LKKSLQLESSLKPHSGLLLYNDIFLAIFSWGRGDVWGRAPNLLLRYDMAQERLSIKNDSSVGEVGQQHVESSRNRQRKFSPFQTVASIQYG